MELIPLEVEDTHPFLAEVPRMVAIHGSTIIGEPAGITTASGVLSVSADTSSSTAHGATQLTDFPESRCHQI